MTHAVSIRSASIIVAGAFGVLLTAAVSHAITCGDVLAPGSETVLTADLGPCDDATGPALTVNSAFLDLNGFSILCSDSAPTNGILPVGILLTGRKSIAGNGTVSGCHQGAVVAGDGKHVLALLSVQGSSEEGVLVSSGKNKIFEIDADDNGGNAITVDGDFNKLLFNVVGQSVSSDGIEVNGDRNKLVANAATNNDSGYRIDGDRNKLVNNLAGNCVTGFTVRGGDNKLVANTALANTEDGFVITLFAVSGGVKVVKNYASANGQNGILVNLPADAKVKVVKNEAKDNHTTSGFDLQDATTGCGSHIWKKNKFETASDPCIH